MSTPDNLLPTDVELRGASIFFHDLLPEEIKTELEHGAKFVQFTIVRVGGACNVILTKSYISPAVAIRDIPNCGVIGGGKVYKADGKDTDSLSSLEERFGTGPIPKDIMVVVRERVLGFLLQE